MQERSFLFLPAFTLILSGIMLSLACHRCAASKVDSVQITPSNFVIPYTLDAPSERYSLAAAELQEISGLSPTATPGQFMAISDEKGEFYLLDLTKGGTITSRVLFKEKGDFEGIEVVGDTVYCIKSDGDLYKISNWAKGGTPAINVVKLGFDDNDIEGLGYDRQRNALLIAAKEDPERSVKRGIWAYSIATGQLNTTPVYNLDPANVDQLVNNDDDNKQRYFSTSGVAVHPISGDIYLISTSLKRLAVLDYATGALKAAVRLDKDVLGQPEGISFDAEGNLYISSEAKKTAAMIAKFTLKKS
jgi:uncharacterized protein YjiK